MKVLKVISAIRSDFEWEAHFYRAPLQAHAKLGPIIETGSSMSRVYDHTKKRNIGCITSWRGGDKADDAQRKKNAELQKALLKEIRDAGFGFIKIKGRYIENKGTEKARNVDEEVALVVGDSTDEGKKKLRTLITKWGMKYGEDIHTDDEKNKYGQESVLFKGYDDKEASLIYTRGEKKGQVEKIGTWHADKIGDFFSAMKGGSTFVFSQDNPEELEGRENKKSENISPSDWWKKMNKDERREYIKKHPNSELKDSIYKDLPKKD